MIYFCIPSHDEAATVGLVLWKIRRVLESSSREYQLLVGDDGSTDSTAEVLAPYATVLPLTVFSSPTVRGYAATLETLLKEALRRSDRHKRDVAIVLPADFSVDIEVLPELLKRLDSGADIVVGEATFDGLHDPWHVRVRRWAPRLLGRRARVEGVSDVVSGFVAFRLVTLRNAFRDQISSWLTVDGWAANAQLLRWAAAGARSVETVEVPEQREQHVRAPRHAPWDRAKMLWAARRNLTVPPDTVRPERPARPATARTQDAA